MLKIDWLISGLVMFTIVVVGWMILLQYRADMHQRVLVSSEIIRMERDGRLSVNY